MTIQESIKARTAPFRNAANFIGGRWVDPGRRTLVRQPIADRRTGHLPGRTQPGGRYRTRAGRRARPGRLGPHQRRRARALILHRIADRMEEDLALWPVETWDNGKPIRETTAADPLAIDHFRYFAGCIRAQEGSISEIDHDTVAYHFHEPLGVVGQIIPWNFPLLMACWKLAPRWRRAIACAEPAEQTPASIMVLAELIADLLPDGVLNIVNGYGVEAGKPLAQNPRIAKIAFTGETTTGQLIMSYASKT
jgi:aldehyde dehydrogenase